MTARPLRRANTNQRRNGSGPGVVRHVAAALILREGKILISQRTQHQAMALKWEFPGGKIEPGESAAQALVRELDEELGIQATAGPEVARVEHRYRSGTAVDLRFFLVNEYSGDIDNRIFRDIRWVTPQELTEYDFLEADAPLVRDLAAGKVI